jgi:hypothetical protein
VFYLLRSFFPSNASRRPVKAGKGKQRSQEKTRSFQPTVELLETRAVPASVSTGAGLNTQLAYGGLNPGAANSSANNLASLGGTFASQGAFVQNFINLALDQFYITLSSAASTREGFVGFQNPTSATSNNALVQAINSNPLNGSQFGNLASLVGMETALSLIATENSTSLLGSSGFGTLGTASGFGATPTFSTTGSASGFGTGSTITALPGAGGFGPTATSTASIGMTAGFGTLPGFIA